MRAFWALLVLILFGGLIFGNVPMASGQGTRMVAVLGLDATGMDPTVADQIADYLREKIAEFEQLTVMDNSSMFKKIQEFPYLTGPFTENEEIIKIGKILEVDYIIAGNIGKIGDLFTISVKLYETKSTESYEAADSYEGTKELFLINTVETMASNLANHILREFTPITTPVMQPGLIVTRPWYKKWWFYAGLGGAALVGGVLAISGDSEQPKKTSDVLPEPPSLPKR
jgi:TolB-like protein